MLCGGVHVTLCVDRVTSVLGYQPQELLGKVAFEFYHPEDQSHMKDTFDQGQFPPLPPPPPLFPVGH